MFKIDFFNETFRKVGKMMFRRFEAVMFGQNWEKNMFHILKAVSMDLLIYISVEYENSSIMILLSFKAFVWQKTEIAFLQMCKVPDLWT